MGTLNIRRRIIIRSQKGTIILTTTHIIGYMRGTPTFIRVRCVSRAPAPGRHSSEESAKACRDGSVGFNHSLTGIGSRVLGFEGLGFGVWGLGSED